MPGLFDGTPLERPVLCDRCGREQSHCDCPPEPAGAAPVVPPGGQDLRVRRERRRGKWSTVVSGLRADPPRLKELLSGLRTHLGAGGGVSDGELVLQGDHRDAVIERLRSLGYRVKASGG